MGAAAGLGLLVAVAGAAGHVRATRPADVSVKVLPSSAETWVGRSVVYNVVVSNLGGEDAAGVRADATIGGEAGGVPVSVTPTLGSCSMAESVHVVCSIDVLPRAATAKIRIQVRPALPGSIDFSSTTSAPGDANTANDTASASTVVRPGKPGPPSVRIGKKPGGATPDPRDARFASIKGRIDVSEPGQLSLKVVGRSPATVVPVLVGTSIGTMKLTVRRTTVTVPVGEAKTTGMTPLLYDIRLPLAKLRATRLYAIVVNVVDLEAEQGNTLEIPFKLSEPKAKPKS